MQAKQNNVIENTKLVPDTLNGQKLQNNSNLTPKVIKKLGPIPGQDYPGELNYSSRRISTSHMESDSY